MKQQTKEYIKKLVIWEIQNEAARGMRLQPKDGLRRVLTGLGIKTTK